MFSRHLQEYALEKYRGRERYYGAIREELERGLKGCTEDEAVLMRFLYGTMPVRDAGEYGFEVFYGYVKHSLWLRENVEWCRELPEDIFVHHVLYCRINSEDISDCRAFFYEKLRDRIAGLTMEEAVSEINYWCAEHAVYESTDSRTASPLTMYRCGKGRCGEESTFAVTAYRSAGIPARQVYTPRWAHCDDNHAWVEVWIHGKWYFLGACEPEAVLNKGWFAAPASRAILIHSRTFSDFVSEPVEECIGKDDLLIYYNNTSFYAKTCVLTVSVKDASGNPVEGASVALEILNMAEYYPAAVLETDAKGETRLTVGLGDIHIRAWKWELMAELTVSPQKNPKAELLLERSAEESVLTDGEWVQEELTAPEEYPMHPGRETKEQKERNAERVALANRLREQRFEECFQGEKAAAYPDEEQMLRTAGENFEELYRFLTKDDNPDRKALLHSLAQKDYKDLKADVLEDHLRCCGENGFMDGEGGTEEDRRELFVKYLLCPRIYLEELTPYRSFIREYFPEEEKNRFREDPDRIWSYIEEHIGYAPEVDYKTICATPVGCLSMGQGNPLSRKILFAAICRSLNIPARLDRATLLPEYLKGDRFTVPEGCREESGQESTSGEKALLTLEVEDGSKWNYFQTWTIGRLKGAAFQTLDYEGLSFTGNEVRLELEPGIYRLITALRLPDGGQHTAKRVFRLTAGERRQIEMTLRETGVDELLVNRPLEDFVLKMQGGGDVTLTELTAGKPFILAFLGVGAEPTEHVLNELLDIAAHWNQAGAEMVMVLRGQEDLGNATLRRVLDKVTGIRVAFDGGEHSERVAAAMQVDPEKLPVLTVAEEGPTGVYACSGYNVGSVDLMLKILRRKV